MEPHPAALSRSELHRAVSVWWRARCEPEAWPGRRDAFATLAALGLTVIPHGTLGHGLSGGAASPVPLEDDTAVVVYTEDVSTRGEGKVLLPHAQACAAHPGALFSVMLGVPGLSFRLLRIGERSFTLRYCATEDWRSNVGDGEDTEVRELARGLLAEEVRVPGLAPIWAVDVVAFAGEVYAIDLNLAPGIQGTRVGMSLSGMTIAGELTAHALAGRWHPGA